MTKPTKSKEQKITLTHPRSGRELEIDKTVYDPIKTAIMQSLEGSRGKTFAELTDEVIKTVRRKNPRFSGSIPWYAISIRLDLETKGIVETFDEKGKRLNRLKKVSN